MGVLLGGGQLATCVGNCLPFSSGHAAGTHCKEPLNSNPELLQPANARVSVVSSSVAACTSAGQVRQDVDHNVSNSWGWRSVQRGISPCLATKGEFFSRSTVGARLQLLQQRKAGRRNSKSKFLQRVVQASSKDRDWKDGEKERSIQLYGKIERVFSESARRSQGSKGGNGLWEEVEGSWVLRPQGVAAQAVVHFIGGAFVGASPHLTYRLFLERLAERGVVVVATPFASGFDHSRIADEAQFKFDRCMRTLRDAQLEALPVFGMGHSLGALTHVLIGSKYAVQRKGNILISFNNKGCLTWPCIAVRQSQTALELSRPSNAKGTPLREASAALPLFSPVIVPFAQRLGPLLQQFTTSPALKMGATLAFQQLKSLNPPLMKDILPLLDQLPPLYQDLADGKDQFVPSPEETDRLVKAYYGVRRNLLVRFENDSIDETLPLAEALRQGSNVGPTGEVAVRTLPGDHARPLQQVLPEIPQGMADAISQGGAFVASLAGGSPFADVAKGFGQSLGSSMDAKKLRQAVTEDIESLVDEVSDWMDTARRAPVTDPSRWLPMA